jgi:steroid 5-alpha reductase family enzyme
MVNRTWNNGCLRNRKGISLLLVVAMLGGLVFVTTAATELIFNLNRGSRAIGDWQLQQFKADPQNKKIRQKI